MKNNATIMSALIFAIILLSPLYVIRFTVFGVPTTVLEILILVTVALWASQKFLCKEKCAAIPQSFMYAIVLIVAGVIIGVSVSTDTVLALGHARAYFVEPMLFGYVVFDVLHIHKKVSFFGRTFSIKQLIVSGWYGASLWLSVLGLLQLIFSDLVVTAHQFDRAHGVFNNGNALALFMGPVLIYKLYEYVIERKKFSARTIIFDVIIFCAFLATKSTGGFLALFIVGVMMFLAHHGFTKIWQWAFIGVSAVFIVFILNISQFTPQVDNPWVRTGGTATIRMCVWEGTRDLLIASPLTGAGLRSFQTVYSQNYTTCDAEPFVYPHNIILNFWVEIGLLGLLGFGLVLFRSFQVGSSQQTVIPAMLMFWVVQGMVDVPYFKNDLALLFWVTIALGVYLSNENESSEVISKGSTVQ